ncbi:hypothetical protein C474_10134 [Halogeometricum pallidum JCM 14848]|uniref:Uncharacterized protein n=1 Tax=Halogeometricum pallidum JCM 14848 TaxID=1227487 RepID=M0DAI3_HALPD|nr:hypothetical protein [Halogeometricum pallidum]ELZ31184.1 hypothetical protein C474_10134 [Halogeometricum pallidum JCM 14848]
MADTKKGREKQARNAETRQQERDVAESRERADEAEPPLPDDEVEEGDEDESPSTCHRRGCEEPAAFVVLERYQEDTGYGAVEAEAFLCREHTAEESPVNLDGVYDEYVFRVEPLPSRSV